MSRVHGHRRKKFVKVVDDSIQFSVHFNSRLVAHETLMLGLFLVSSVPSSSVSAY